MRVAVLVKQIPKLGAELTFTAEGRLQRVGVPLEMNPYCRRAVSKGVEVAKQFGGTCTVITLGPPAAADCLREAVAWGANDGVLVSDPAFAGSDTLATATALAAALRRTGPYDLVLVGQNSVDADTGHVGPSVAELLDLPFVGPATNLQLDGTRVAARCSRDDGWLEVTVDLPAVVACAERLCQPCKAAPEARDAVDAALLATLDMHALGPGPWGEAGSPTKVGRTRELAMPRRRVVLQGDVVDQIRRAVEILDRGGLLRPLSDTPAVATPALPEHRDTDERSDRSRDIAVVTDYCNDRVTRELLAAAARLAARVDGRVVAVGGPSVAADRLCSWGADHVISLIGSTVEEDVARALTEWCREVSPWAVLLPGTLPGRQVGARTAAALGAGLVGDAVDLDVEQDRLVAWKPAYGDSIVAAITSTSNVQMVTVRPGVLPLADPRHCSSPPPVTTRQVACRSRVCHTAEEHEGGVGDLVRADVVIGVGTGVDPTEYPLLDPLLALLGAELAATRKVTDRGWLPRSRQVGITGHSIGPRLYLAIGSSGKSNHMIGVRTAGTVVAINCDKDAEVFRSADVGIVADWRAAVSALTAELGALTHA